MCFEYRPWICCPYRDVQAPQSRIFHDLCTGSISWNCWSPPTPSTISSRNLTGNCVPRSRLSWRARYCWRHCPSCRMHCCLASGVPEHALHWITRTVCTLQIVLLDNRQIQDMCFVTVYWDLGTIRMSIPSHSVHTATVPFWFHVSLTTLTMFSIHRRSAIVGLTRLTNCWL